MARVCIGHKLTPPVSSPGAMETNSSNTCSPPSCQPILCIRALSSPHVQLLLWVLLAVVVPVLYGSVLDASQYAGNKSLHLPGSRARQQGLAAGLSSICSAALGELRGGKRKVHAETACCTCTLPVFSTALRLIDLNMLQSMSAGTPDLRSIPRGWHASP